MTEARDFISMLAQGLQKVAEIKIIGGECVNRYKNMSYSQINSLIKAVQDEKLTKVIKKDRLLLALPFRKFQWTPMEPTLIVVSGRVSMQRRCPSPDHNLVLEFKCWQRHQDNPPPALFTRYCHSGLYSLPEGEVGAGRPLVIIVQLPDEPGTSKQTEVVDNCLETEYA
jgi:hypothetical protein